MRPVVPLALLLGLGAVVSAQETPMPPPAAQDAPKPAEAAPPPPAAAPPTNANWIERRITIGGELVDLDRESSRFREYRSVHEGFVVPMLKIGGQTGDKRWQVTGLKVGQDDARYRGYVTTPDFRVQLSLTRVPHNFGDNGRELVTQDRYALAAQNQAAIERQRAINPASVNFAFLNNLLAPQIAAAPVVDVGLERDMGRLEMDLFRNKPVEVKLVYNHEERNGERQSGTSFGFGNVVETREPIDYRTQDLLLSAQYGLGKATLRAALRWNRFTNHNLFQTFGNPFRATDATDASAYQAPGSASIAGAALGRIALPPTNQGITGTLGVKYRFNDKNKLNADVSYGRITQDEEFIPFSTNTSIRTPFDVTDRSHLPQQSLDGELDVLSINAVFNSRLTDSLNLNVRARRYDMDNQTPRVRFEEGYVRFEGVFEDIPRITVPYGYTNDRASAALTWSVDKGSLEAGYRLNKWERTFRETEDTKENTLYVSGVLRPVDKLNLRATAERGRREFAGTYEAEEAEDASFLRPGAPANLTLLRRPDQANRDVRRYMVLAEVNPVDEVTLALSWLRQEQEYTELTHGLLSADSDAFTAEVDVQPNTRVNLFAFYTAETQNYFQRGRQSGATVSVDERDDWTSEQDYDGDSFGAGAVLNLVPEKVDLTLNASRQKIDALNDFELVSTAGLPGVARATFGGTPADIENYDDTKLTTFGAELAWTFAKGLTAGVGGWFEQYRLEDDATRAVGGGLPNFTPGGYFIAGDDGDYEGKVFYARLSYAW